MSGNVDLEDLGNQALVFAFGHNVNLYEDVFNIAVTSSTKEIRITYTGLIKELEIARVAFQDYNDQDNDQRQYAMLMGMKESHLAVGMHPRDFLEIKKDAVERAFLILSNKKSRAEYDGCLREFQESFENEIPENDAVHDVSDEQSQEDEELEDVDFNDGNDTFFDPSTVQAQAKDSEFPILTSHHYNNDIFDPFHLDQPRQKVVSFADEQSFDFAHDPFAVPVSPDGSISLSASFTGMHPHGHETAVRICALPAPDSEESSYPDLTEGKHRLEPEGDILLISDLSSEEEDELVSFQELSKSMSDLEQKQEQFFSQMDVALDNVECFSQDDSDIVEHHNADRMDMTSGPKEDLELDEIKQGQHVWNCLDACMEEVTGTLDDTALTIEQICGISPIENQEAS